MEKLLDFSKYTMAIAVGMMLYVPANFVPRATQVGAWAVMTVMCMLLISTLAAFLLFSRVTTLVVTGATSDAKGWTKFWGRIHLSLLGLSFAAVAVMFYDTKLTQVSAPPRCTVSLPVDQGGNAVNLNFDCSVEIDAALAKDSSPSTDEAKPAVDAGAADAPKRAPIGKPAP